jgi:hypothetical protein
VTGVSGRISAPFFAAASHSATAIRLLRTWAMSGSRSARRRLGRDFRFEGDRLVAAEPLDGLSPLPLPRLERPGGFLARIVGDEQQEAVDPVLGVDGDSGAISRQSGS